MCESDSLQTSRCGSFSFLPQQAVCTGCGCDCMFVFALMRYRVEHNLKIVTLAIMARKNNNRCGFFIHCSKGSNQFLDTYLIYSSFASVLCALYHSMENNLIF